MIGEWHCLVFPTVPRFQNTKPKGHTHPFVQSSVADTSRRMEAARAASG